MCGGGGSVGTGHACWPLCQTKHSDLYCKVPLAAAIVRRRRRLTVPRLRAETGKLLVRDNAIILSIEHVRLIITADKVGSRPCTALLVCSGWSGRRLERRLRGLLPLPTLPTDPSAAEAMFLPSLPPPPDFPQVLVPREGYEHNPLRRVGGRGREPAVC